MRTIFKYPLRIVTKQEIEVPVGSSVLHVGLDATGKPCIWFEVEKDAADAGMKETIVVYVIGTGHPIPEEASYHVGSFVISTYIWHIYI